LARWRRWLGLRSGMARFLVAAIAGVIAALGVPAPWTTRIQVIVGWDAGAALFLVLSWNLIARTTPPETRARAARDDPGRHVVFVIAVASALAGLFAAMTALHETRSLAAHDVSAWTALALAAVAMSWTVTHTAFTLRYAHLYYDRSDGAPCLRFPDDGEPTDMDFAYFAFTIGMCFQVSDVTIMAGDARRVVLLHSLLSFVYNTTILALTLNLVTSVLP
jgi:uncharacterized membrane protein